jgi:hypothetical protein
MRLSSGLQAGEILSQRGALAKRLSRIRERRLCQRTPKQQKCIWGRLAGTAEFCGSVELHDVGSLGGRRPGELMIHIPLLAEALGTIRLNAIGKEPLL